MKYANQKEGTFAVVCAVLEKFGQKFTQGTNYLTSLTKPMKEEIVTRLVAEFNAGNIPLTRPQGDKLDSYCVGLLNNWLRKDSRLNGGTKYVGQVGNSDPAIREARKLLDSGKITDPAIRAKIESTIEKLVAEKKPKQEIDVSKLPEELRKFVA